jgi:tRNA-modifying protein YgfZ
LSRFSLLTSETLLHISGPDTATFLQGQTTCDTSQVNEERAAPGVYCTPQGRVVCDFVLAQLEENHFGLRMRKDIRSHAAAVFGKYIVFSKAELEATRDDWLVIAAWGENTSTDLAQVFGRVPQEQWEAVAGTGFVVIQTDDSQQHFEIYIAADHEKLGELKSISGWEDEAVWQEEQILQGIARIEAATVETLVPQVLNFDLTGHISFTKGCYTGQEVVARLHYRGKSKRRMYVSRLPANAQAGDPVFSAGKEQSVGNIVNCVAGEDNLALVAATTDAAEGMLRLHSADGAELTLQAPPYPFEQES